MFVKLHNLQNCKKCQQMAVHELLLGFGYSRLIPYPVVYNSLNSFSYSSFAISWIKSLWEWAAHCLSKLPRSHQEHCYSLWQKTWWVNAEKLTNPEFRSSPGCAFLTLPLNAAWWERSSARHEARCQHEVRIIHTMAWFISCLFYFSAGCSELVWGGDMEASDMHM